MSKINCNVRVVEVKKNMKGSKKEALGLSGTYKFRYDYPLSTKVVFPHKLKKDMTALDLLVIGRSDYERIYKEEDQDVGKSTPMIPGMLNREFSEGRYGIWGHIIDDLFFEGIDIRGKSISFGMGS